LIKPVSATYGRPSSQVIISAVLGKTADPADLENASPLEHSPHHTDGLAV
jgi:hypothetical protein